MSARKRGGDPVRRLAMKGFRGYPIGTVAFYGPDDQRATKVAVGIVPTEDSKTTELERWIVDEGDVRGYAFINKEIAAFLERHGVRSVAMTDRIMGCPHEEVTDYPEGDSCPYCPFWRDRDRFTGEPNPPTG